MAQNTTDVEVSRLLSDLKTSAARLNAATDVINGELQSTESQIRDMNIGLECWPPGCELDHRPRIGSQIFDAICLGFAHVSKSWCLAVRTMTGIEGSAAEFQPECEPSPLLQAPRPIRIAALEKLPLLIVALKEKADEAAIATQDAAREIERSKAPSGPRRQLRQLGPIGRDRYGDQCRKQIEGHLTSYIARANDDPGRIMKTIRTLMAQCGMTRDELAKMFDEIYPGSVRSFLEAPVGSGFREQGPARDERFRLLKTELL
jgi:hypothetical protein